MDQLKEQLAVVMKHGFWISTAIILLGAVVIWYLVTGRLVAENEERTRKIEGYVQQVNNVRSELSNHPNQISHDQMEVMIENRQSEVLEAWQTVFDAQREILTWPRDVLQAELVNDYESLIPIEAFIEFPPTEEQEVETTLRNSYKRYIGNVLPDLAKIANTEWVAEMNASSPSMGMGMGMGMEDDMGMGMDPSMMRGGMANIDITGAEKGPLVKWPAASQEGMIRELFPWWPNRPSTLDVYYSQENLWILRQLLAIVADVNGDAKQAFEAKIHEINRLSMGRRVRFGAGAMASPGMGSMAAMMGMGMDMDGMEMDGMEMGMDMEMDGMMGMDGMMMMGETVDPADNRYVDTLMEPIDGATLRAAFASTSPEDAPLKVAKRVPVMMSLQIDQRAVPDLIASCGSAPLMVEVKQTRVLPKSAGANAASGMDMDMGMGMEMDMGMGMDEEMGMGMGSYGRASNEPKDPFPFDVTVEIYGLIHIYNPPEEDKLGVEQVTTETVLDGEAMGDNVSEPAQAAPRVPTPAAPTETDPSDSSDTESDPATAAPDTAGPEADPAPTAETPPPTGAEPAAPNNPESPAAVATPPPVAAATP